MAEHEPDPIERMAQAAHDDSASFRRWEDLDRESRLNCCSDMLAAVRELRQWLLDNQTGTWNPSEQIGLIILAHERRAGGKGE